jgi:bifunctional non-homologous end joining protein LigD
MPATRPAWCSFLFDLLYLDGELPLIDRKARLAALLSIASSPLHYSDHQRGQGRAFVTSLIFLWAQR